MGVGTNVQARAIALHHLDAPWRPADMDQRDGRILRQGNLNPEVTIIRYVTEGSFDTFMLLVNRTTWSAVAVRGGATIPRTAREEEAVRWLLSRTGRTIRGDKTSRFETSPVSRSAWWAPWWRTGQGVIPFRLVFPDDARAERAANAFLADLSHTFARPLTLRSYAFDVLRWLRFLVGVEVVFDQATRGDYTDYRRWLIDHGKTGGARRPRAEPQPGRLNRVTGKVLPDEVQFDPATIRHSRVVLHEWYEFLAERGCPPLLNPIPHSRRWAPGEPRTFAHHNPLEPFPARRARRVDPPDPQMTPRHLTDAHFQDFWAELSSDRNRALVKITVDCGIRPGELLALRGEDIDWGNAVVHVVRKGGRKAQWLPVSGDASVVAAPLSSRQRVCGGVGRAGVDRGSRHAPPVGLRRLPGGVPPGQRQVGHQLDASRSPPHRLRADARRGHGCGQGATDDGS